MFNTILNATITATMIAAIAYMAIALVTFTHDRIVYRATPTVTAVEVVEQPAAIEPSTAPVIAMEPPAMSEIVKPLESMTWRELQPVAKTYGVKNRRNKSKAQLLKEIYTNS
ncbi:hypothetical protein [[Limnothrix rosea] IAM M-220]|uniref:hypothetical protein n=1 Tax=[Limnothrix rosea] IAM M-220 TaxID=454133 RepID=UPI0009651C6B|nr:hypothetical protein [[Limnothrix rosea] IAM M-220]OKH12307.1 hypothetical protein NIES208_16300 [[Limnothrix rosea] IAM M-220]